MNRPLKVKDGQIKHKCQPPREDYLTDRGDEFVCPDCWQVWVAVRIFRPWPTWEPLRLGFWRRRVYRDPEGEQ